MLAQEKETIKQSRIQRGIYYSRAGYLTVFSGVKIISLEKSLSHTTSTFGHDHVYISATPVPWKIKQGLPSRVTTDYKLAAVGSSIPTTYINYTSQEIVLKK